MSWLKHIFSRRRLSGELSQEIREHLEEKIENLVATGMSRKDAEHAARREFGNLTLVQEDSREIWRWPRLENSLADVRFAVRTLRKSPGFTLIVILTLALGIGANTAIFSYVNAWVLKPLPYAQADRLMVLLAHDTKKGWIGKDIASTADFLEYQKQATGFENLAGWTAWYFNLTSDGPPDRVEGGLVSCNFFQTLGVQPVLGRAFLPQEGQPGSSHVAIISRGLWESRFAANPQVIGRTLKLQGADYTIVGVMPADFHFPLMGSANIWSPFAFDDQQRADRNTSWFQAFGRLKSGVTEQQAAAEITAIAARLEKLYPQTNTNITSLLSPMTVEIGKNEGAPQILMQFWVVGLVLLIACVNVANLMLARASGRTREFAVRGALGASRSRLIRQLLTESLLLFSAGGVAGVLFAVWINRWVESAIPERIRGYLMNYGHVDLDFTTFTYTFSLAILCGIIFGLAPAFEGTGLDFARALKESAGNLTGSQRAGRIRRIFVAGEIALAVVVLVSTALLVESLVHMVEEGLGFQPQNLMTAQLVVPPNKYTSDAQVRNFYDRVLERVRALPGVVSAAASQYVPFGDAHQTERIQIVGQPPAQAGEEPATEFTAVTSNYFSTLQIPLLRGRFLDPQDGPGIQNVVVSESLVRRNFPREDPIGRQLLIPQLHMTLTIIGVVQDVKQISLSEPLEPQLYVSAAQSPSGYMSLVARTSRPSPELAVAIRDAVWSVDSEQPVSKVRTMDDLIIEQNTLMRVTTQMISFFGLLALLLGAVGIYGVMAHSVGQRIHEIGIRMALGATGPEVLRLVLMQGLKLTFLGIAIGLLGAAGVTRALSSMLYKVRSSDPVTFALVAVFFTFLALAACYIPARRGARVDPMIALRYE